MTSLASAAILKDCSLLAAQHCFWPIIEICSKKNKGLSQNRYGYTFKYSKKFLNTSELNFLISQNLDIGGKL